jgi:hypothetical protein
MLRSEIQAQSKLSSGGGSLSKRLDSLKETGFIEEYMPLGKERGEFFVVIDEYCLFYVRWVHPFKQIQLRENSWLILSQCPAYYMRSGYAFEALCIKPSEQIIKALKIPSAITFSHLRYVPKGPGEEGAHIDFFIYRTDDSVSLCEIKYTEQFFIIDKSYARILRQKVECFQSETKSND